MRERRTKKAASLMCCQSKFRAHWKRSREVPKPPIFFSLSLSVTLLEEPLINLQGFGRVRLQENRASLKGRASDGGEAETPHLFRPHSVRELLTWPIRASAGATKKKRPPRKLFFSLLLSRIFGKKEVVEKIKKFCSLLSVPELQP